MKYINVFDKDTDYVSYRDGNGYIKPNVSLSRDTKKVHYYLYANGHEYMDLGLPSGTLWATMNVGASSSGETGLYFQWGDTSGYTAREVGGALPAKVSKSNVASVNNSASSNISSGTERVKDLNGNFTPGSGKVLRAFNWSDYKWYLSGSGNTISFKKYTVTGTTLDLEDDAAHVNMGGDWHMPTPAQIQELLDNTTTAWTTSDGVSGMTFTSKKDTSKSIFIPAAGSAENGSVRYSGTNGRVWSSMLNKNAVNRADSLYFISEDNDLNVPERCYGIPIRGVIG